MPRGLEAGDVGLPQAEPAGELALADPMIGAVGDQARRDRPGQREALPLLTEVLVEQLLADDLALCRNLSDLRGHRASFVSSPPNRDYTMRGIEAAEIRARRFTPASRSPRGPGRERAPSRR